MLFIWKVYLCTFSPPHVVLSCLISLDYNFCSFEAGIVLHSELKRKRLGQFPVSSFPFPSMTLQVTYSSQSCPGGQTSARCSLSSCTPWSLKIEYNEAHCYNNLILYVHHTIMISGLSQWFWTTLVSIQVLHDLRGSNFQVRHYAKKNMLKSKSLLLWQRGWSVPSEWKKFSKSENPGA